MNKLRTFLSLNINSTLREKVTGVQAELKQILSTRNIKWEDPDKFHLTIRFLGDVDIKDADGIINELEKQSFSFNKLLFYSDSIDCFPNKRRPNVIFLKLVEEGRNTPEMEDVIDSVLIKYGIKPDKKFVPHITLGRFRREDNRGVEITGLPMVERVPFEFNKFYMMKSVLDFKGARHSVLKEFLFRK